MYLEIFPDAKLLSIRRNVDDVAASMAHRFKPGIGILNDPDHWRELTKSYFDRVDKFGKRHERYFELDYEDLCTDPAKTISAVYEFLELPLTSDVIEDAKRTAKKSSMGTRHWSNGRWWWEMRKRKWKRVFAPIYDAIRGKA